MIHTNVCETRGERFSQLRPNTGQNRFLNPFIKAFSLRTGMAIRGGGMLLADKQLAALRTSVVRGVQF
jgi:hypothetical protein